MATSIIRPRPVSQVEMTPSENELEVFVAAANTIWTPERANEVHRVPRDLIPLLAKNTHLSLRDLGFLRLSNELRLLTRTIDIRNTVD